jgi:tetratricopeptide (TPR) repeat protein
MEIEMYSPAEITYPPSVRKVLVACNAVPQPPDSNCLHTVNGIYLEDCKAPADSALGDACRYLGKALVAAEYFDDVLLFDGKLRADSNGYNLYRKASAADVQALCDETGAHALITFDRLTFYTQKEIKAVDGYLNGTISVYINGIAGSYLPEEGDKPYAVIVADSIFLSEWGETQAQVNSRLPSPEEALRIAARYVAEKVSSTFVPHWERGNRWIYTNSGSRWKEGSAYAAAGKWEAAAERWQALFDAAAGKRTRARLASNLALCHELTGNLEQARGYASISASLLLEDEGAESYYTLLQSQYEKTLKQRIEDDRKLNRQLQEPPPMMF